MENDTLKTMKDDVINIRVSKELKKALQDISDKEYLPISRVVLRALLEKYPDLLDIVTKG